MPAAKPDIVVLAPVPAITPGLIIQFPAGKPLSTTLPVASAHVGCVMIPAAGATGVEGWAAINTLEDNDEVHPVALVTVKLYVPETSPEIVVLVPVPVITPGFIVQVPVDGKPFSTTLPVDIEQVG